MEIPLSDTSPQAEAVLIELARALPPWRKLEIALGMTAAVRQAALAGIRSRHPQASEEEARKRLAALLLPRELAIAAYGWDPEKEGY
ncbi:MAG: hypothetical protein HY717_13545 [Planctomycetes bacterium]|nr:hypothetical protein [Planctomycetota bacterium]